MRFNLDFVGKDTANFVTKKGKENNFFWKTFLCLSVQKVINNRYVLITNRIKLYTSIYNIGKGDILFHLLLYNYLQTAKWNPIVPQKSSPSSSVPH